MTSSKPRIDVPIIRGNRFVWQMRFLDQDFTGPFATPGFGGVSLQFRAAWPSGELRKNSDDFGGGIVKTDVEGAIAELYLSHVETRSLPVPAYAPYELWLQWTDHAGNEQVKTYAHGFLKAGWGINDDKFEPIASLGDDLVAWWNPLDLIDGTITTDGNNPSWIDRKSGLAFLQGTGSAGPSRSATAFNAAYPGIAFDGNDFLNIGNSNGLLLGPDPGGILVAFQPTVLTAGYLFGYGGGSASRAVRVTSSKFVVTNGAVNMTDATTLVAGKPYLGSGLWADTTESGTLNGAPTNPASATIATLNTINSRTRAGSDLASVPSIFLTGVLSDILVHKPLTADKFAKLQGYIAHKNGHSADTPMLPPSHPYFLHSPDQ